MSDNPRRLRQRKKTKYDSPEDSDNPKPVPRTRKQPKLPSTRRPKKLGRLASFVNLPLDILHEVFAFLHPHELLKLARTTKDFRRILMHRSSISTWKQSFENVKNLPECPPNMSEPAWANLVFSPQCHVCLVAGVRNVDWQFRSRMCSKCAVVHLKEAWNGAPVDQVYEDIPGKFGEPGQKLPDIRYLLPNREGRRWKRVYKLQDLIDFRDKYNALQSDEDRLAFIDERRKETEAINLHSTNCAAWFINQADDRSDELNRLRTDRKSAIVKKLKELGYGKDVDSIRYPDALARQPFVNKPQRLTERIWNNIKPAAIKYMDEMRRKRLEREHQALIISRKAFAVQFLRQAKNLRLQAGETELMPEAPDFCDFPEVRAILEQPADVTVDASSFEEATHPIEALFARWRNEAVIPDLHRCVAYHELYGYMRENRSHYPRGSRELLAQLPKPTEAHRAPLLLSTAEDDTAEAPTLAELDRKMKLASTVYTCGRCDGCSDLYDGPFFGFGGLDEYDYDSDSDSDTFGWHPRSSVSRGMDPLFFPEVLAHPCLTRGHGNFHDFMAPLGTVSDMSTQLRGTGLRRRKWNATSLKVDSRMSEVASLVVKLAGLNPKTATVGDMDALNIRFSCSDCLPQLRLNASKVAASTDGADGTESDDPDFFIAGEVTPYFDWRGAVAHQLEKHTRVSHDLLGFLAVSVSSSKRTVKNLRPIYPGQALHMIVTSKEAEAEAEAEEEIWVCGVCRDTPSEVASSGVAKVEAHLRDDHDVEEPALGRDYFKHFAAKDIKCNYVLLEKA